MEGEKFTKIEGKKGWLKKEFFEKELERKSPEFQQFLAEQVFLPPEKQDKKFKDYVEKKYKFWREQVECFPGWSADEEKERQFKRHLNLLDLTEKDLENKKILDLGCGVEGNFVKTCIENRITTDIYGLDFKINPDEFEEKYKKQFFREDFTKKIPGGNYDYIIAIGSIGGHRQGSEKIKKIITLALDALKDGGELRISGVWDSLEAREKNNWFAKKDWQNIIEDLAKDKKIEYKFQPYDILVDQDVALQEVLIIKKKPKK